MPEPVKITKKITGYKVVIPEEVPNIELTDRIEVNTSKRNEAVDLSGAAENYTHEEVFGDLKDFDRNSSVEYLTRGEVLNYPKSKLKRPLRLDNEWRLKPPYANHALYVRLNAIEYEGKKYPYEIFFNTKDVKDIKWLNALTVTISTAFRTAIETGTSLQPLIDNFKESCDTESPYPSKVTEKPKYVNGLVAEIGLVIEVFNRECLTWNYSESSHERPATEGEKEAAFFSSAHGVPYKLTEAKNPPPNATTCKHCGALAVVILDGCKTCLECGDSYCG